MQPLLWGSGSGPRGVRRGPFKFWKFYYNIETEQPFHSAARPPGAIVERIQLALIGAGRMGQVHGPNAARHPGLQLKYVVDPRPEAAQAMCQRFDALPATLEQALADPSIQGVLVCSSTDQHLANALAAVEAG